MPKPTKPKRPAKPARFTNEDATTAETLVHYVLAPFDRAAREMDTKWGIDRLPELVSPDMAAIWGNTMANLNAAIAASYDAEDHDQARADIIACVESALRGFKAMDAHAEAHGAPKANTGMIEADVDGYRFCILRDDMAWQAVKRDRPDLRPVSIREVATALKFYETHGVMLEAAKEHFPSARLKPTELPPGFWANGGDEINF